MGAIANAIGYYAIGLPIGISLMFVAKMGVLGTCVLCLALCELPARLLLGQTLGPALRLVLRSSFSSVGLGCSLKC